MLEQHDNNSDKSLDHHAGEEQEELEGKNNANHLDISSGSSEVGDSRQDEEQGKADR